MKRINTKSISILSIVIVIVLFFSSAYNLMISYNDYREVKRDIEYTTLIKKLDKILYHIERGKESTEIYLESKDKGDFEDVRKEHDTVIYKIKNTLTYINHNNELVAYKKSLEELLIQIDYFWSKVNILTLDNRDILGESYAQKIINPLIFNIEILSTHIKSQKKRELTNYLKLLKLRENLNMEKSFLLHIVGSKEKMNREDLLLWDAFVKYDIKIDFSNIENSHTVYELNKIINPTEFFKIGNYERGMILLSSLDGEYPFVSKKWAEIFTNKIDKVNMAQQMLLSKITIDIQENILNYNNKLSRYLLISIFFFLLLLVWSYFHLNSYRNSQFLSETLKNLESDLDEKQRKEIKKVIGKNNTIEIYKFLANAIREPSRAKDHFLANMSHEIRTPLNGIIGFTNILKETELREDQKEFLSIIEESSTSLMGIVNDILDFSKVTSGKIEFENVPFNVIEKLESSIDAYAAKAVQKKIELGVSIDPSLQLELMGDSTKISQVIINLLSNAIKFTNEGGEVNIRIKKLFELEESVQIKFEVEDSGIGISEAYKNKIFDAFSQADASTSRKFGGTGLGLAISSKFVELMGGKLEVESELGVGTTFSFAINLKKSESSMLKDEPKMGYLKVGYVIENDEKSKREVDKNLEAYIKYSGANFQVYTYSEIFNVKKVSLPDIIFVDQNRTKDIKKISRLFTLDKKIVLLSTAEVNSCSNSIKNNVSKILYKPINFSKTMRTLKLLQSCVLESTEDVTSVETITSSRVFTGIKTLVVEDNIINQKLVKNIFESFDMTVTVASSGAEALTLRKEKEFDIIFMDIHMPKMDGVEATEKIIEYEEDYQKEHVPIVALTANSNASDKMRFMAAGMDRYLEKPINIEALTKILEEHFPIQEIRDSINLENNKSMKEENKLVILYKETDLTGKIYAAILQNLGYEVETYSSRNEFLEQLNNKAYRFAFFDVKPFEEMNSSNLVVELIRDSGAIPIALVEKNEKHEHCFTINSVDNVNKIQQRLLHAEVA